MRTAGDVLDAVSAVSAAVSAGKLTPDEGQAVAAILGVQRRTIETVAIEKRLAALKSAVGAKR